MKVVGKLTLTTPSDREIVMARDFNAPRPLVFDAMTKPELVKRWLLGPDGWSMPICDIDLRVGGKYRYVWRNDADGAEFGLVGTYMEIVPPKRVVNTEAFEPAMHPGEAICTIELIERDGMTHLSLHMLFETKEIRDGALSSGMESGVEASYSRLEAIFEKEMAS